jgi:hypothetical protein
MYFVLVRDSCICFDEYEHFFAEFFVICEESWMRLYFRELREEDIMVGALSGDEIFDKMCSYTHLISDLRISEEELVYYFGEFCLLFTIHSTTFYAFLDIDE